MQHDVAPPSGGTPPPATAELADGEILHLTPLADEISRRFLTEYPDEEERYGGAVRAWCVHDNQWLLAWAAEDQLIGSGHFAKNLAWLARLLRARGYRIERLARDLEIAADVVAGDADVRATLRRTLREGAKTLRPN